MKLLIPEQDGLTTVQEVPYDPGLRNSMTKDLWQQKFLHLLDVAKLTSEDFGKSLLVVSEADNENLAKGISIVFGYPIKLANARNITFVSDYVEEISKQFDGSEDISFALKILLSESAKEATKLAQAREFIISGVAKTSSAANFDGTENVNLAVEFNPPEEGKTYLVKNGGYVEFDPYDEIQWLGMPVGTEFIFDTNMPLPPTDNPRFRYIILSAGLTGPGEYNEGALDNEVVTGSDPVIVAKADIALEDSPLLGTTVDLINTSRAFLRPAESVGAIVDSTNKSHTHTGTISNSGEHSHSGVELGGSGATVGTDAPVAVGSTTSSAGEHTHTVSIDSSGDTEAAPRYIPRVYMKRIK